MRNPFEDLDLSALEHEIKKRQAYDRLIDYETFVHPDYIVSKFHKFLCDTVQDFIEQDTTASFDVLCLSVPPQH